VARKGQGGEAERLQHGQRLDDDQQPAFVGPVGHQPGEGAEKENRAELGGGQPAEGVTAVVSFRTSRVWATSVSQLPIWEMS